MQVVLVQEASSLDPAVNRGRLAELVPDGADLVVLPESFARDFGDPGSDVVTSRGAAGRALRDRGREGRRRAWDDGRGRDVRGGRRAALQHPRGPRRRDRGLPQDPPLRLVRLPGVAGAGGRRDRARRARARRLHGRDHDLLRPALPGARPPPGRRGGRGDRGPRGLGRRDRARSTTGRRSCGPGRSRTPPTSWAWASPGRATPVTRWWSGRSATCWSRPATARRCYVPSSTRLTSPRPVGPTRPWPTGACSVADRVQGRTPPAWRQAGRAARPRDAGGAGPSNRQR